jgi:transposase-like protein
MRQKSGSEKPPAEDAIRDIRRATRRHFSAEEKIRIVLEGLRGEESIAELCRREGIASSMYYGWSKEFLEAERWHQTLKNRILLEHYYKKIPVRKRMGSSGFSW